MKKIFTLLSAAMFAVTLNAQTTLTQNTDDIVTGSNSVACQGGDNFWARNFTLADYEISGEFTIESGRIGVQTIASNEIVTVNVYATDYDFPWSNQTLLGTQSVEIPVGTDVSYVEYTFDTPIVVPAGTESVAVEVHQPMTGVSFFIGGTADETAEGFLKSVQCELPDYGYPSEIGFPDAHFYITVTGTEANMGTFELGANAVSVYPNPATDVINVSLKNGATVESIEIINLAGKSVFATKAGNSANVSFLPAGVYVVKTIDNKGVTHVSKIVKK